MHISLEDEYFRCHRPYVASSHTKLCSIVLSLRGKSHIFGISQSSISQLRELDLMMAFDGFAYKMEGMSFAWSSSRRDFFFIICAQATSFKSKATDTLPVKMHFRIFSAGLVVVPIAVAIPVSSKCTLDLCLIGERFALGFCAKVTAKLLEIAIDNIICANDCSSFFATTITPSTQ